MAFVVVGAVPVKAPSVRVMVWPVATTTAVPKLTVPAVSVMPPVKANVPTPPPAASVYVAVSAALLCVILVIVTTVLPPEV